MLFKEKHEMEIPKVAPFFVALFCHAHFRVERVEFLILYTA